MRMPGGFGFERMTEGLKLTDEQQKKVDELVKKMPAPPTDEERAARRETAKKNFEALLDAFEKDTFDATKLAFAKPELGDWNARSKVMLDNFSAFLAILTEEQRNMLAERLSRGGSHTMFGVEPPDPYDGILSPDKDEAERDKAEKDESEKDHAESDGPPKDDSDDDDKEEE